MDFHFLVHPYCLSFFIAFCLLSGTSNGSVLMYNLTSGLLHKELSVHSCEVR